MIEATIEVKAVSLANMRLHWAVKAKITKDQRNKARTAMALVCPLPPGVPLTIILTRVGARRLDTDNLASSMKAVRDGIADWLGIDDGHPGLEWVYQQKTAPGRFCVEVEVV